MDLIQAVNDGKILLGKAHMPDEYGEYDLKEGVISKVQFTKWCEGIIDTYDEEFGADRAHHMKAR